MTKYITRVAPSPTGDFHIGTARTALFNWLAARTTGGTFFLRVDDTDDERNIPAAVDTIHECLSWLDLKPDYVFHQSNRMARYQEVADQLLSAGKAQVAENGAVLLNGVDALPWTDYVGGVQVPNEQHHEIARNQVLIRGNGGVLYHFASVVDDIDHNVNLIIRGADHMTNCFRHSAIYNALRAKLPTFAHCGLIMHNKKKMSKRDAAASLLGYRDAGISSEAMTNFLLRMGWGPKVDNKSTATISRNQALDLFLTGGTMKASPANFDLDKLAWYNRKYSQMAA